MSQEEPRPEHPEVDDPKEVQPIDELTKIRLLAIISEKARTGTDFGGHWVRSLGWKTIGEGVLNVVEYRPGVELTDSGDEILSEIDITKWTDEEKPYEERTSTIYRLLRTPEGVGMDRWTIGGITAEMFPKAGASAEELAQAAEKAQELIEKRGKIARDDFISQAEGERLLKLIKTAGPRPDGL